MATEFWPTKSVKIASVHLDQKNPRLGREFIARAPREIIQYLFDHDDALEIADSIAKRGFFPNEPLLAVKDSGRLVIIEGNRRLAALKALKEPGLLDGRRKKQVERLIARHPEIQQALAVPVTVAPNRRATDKQIVGRHIGTPVRAWQGENRASFILDKLSEGYDNEALRDELGFTLADIQGARQTRAIADMARSLDLPEEVMAKLDNPRAKIFSTLERVFESAAGRDFLKVDRSPDHGLIGRTSKAEFVRGFKKLVSDIALGKQSSRSLNTSENIRSYFETWSKNELPQKQGSFVPADVITGKSIASPQHGAHPKPKRNKQRITTVLPKNFKVRFGSERLMDIAGELKKLDRIKFRNSGAVLLRVFLELAITDYLTRTGDLPKIVAKLEKHAGRSLPHGLPTMRQLANKITQIARERLTKKDEILRVEKALRYDAAAPFSISDLHSFVHSPDLPGERDILQFWIRTEPLFRLMLEQDIPATE